MSRGALRVLLAAFVLIFTAPRLGLAQTYTDIFIFGDSLSDTGNIFAGTFGFYPPDPPYFQGRFSDGPVWVEYLADRLGLSVIANGADSTIVYGNNFAVGGAEAAFDVPILFGIAIPSLRTQVDCFIAASPMPLPADALYVLYAGNNDLLNPDFDEKTKVIQDAVDAIADSITALAAMGAKDFVIPNIADLGVTPAVKIENDNSAESTAIAVEFNAAISSQLAILSTQLDIRILHFDLFSLGEQIIEDAINNEGMLFGITNIDTPVFSGADPAISMFADDLHPSGKIHRIFGHEVFNELMDYPSLFITANPSAINPDQILRVSIGMTVRGAPETVPTVAIFFGIILPDNNTAVMFTDLNFNTVIGSLSELSSLVPIALSLDLADQFSFNAPDFFTYTWSGNEPAGVYTFFICATVPNGFADNTLDKGDILSWNTATFSFSP